MKRRSWVLLFFIVAGTLVAFFLFKKEKEQVTVIANPAGGVPVRGNLSPVEPPIEKPVTEASSQAPKIAMSPRKERSPKSASRGRAIDMKEAKIETVPWLAATNWKLWVGVSARDKKNGPPSGRLLGEVNGYYLFEDFTQTDVREFSQQEPWVVIDPRLKIAGVVTGVFSVTLKEGASAEVLKNVPGLLIRDSFPDIRTYFVTAAEKSFDLQSLKNFLQSESSVERVELEILSRQYEKY